MGCATSYLRSGYHDGGTESCFVLTACKATRLMETSIPFESINLMAGCTMYAPTYLTSFDPL